MHPRQCIVPRAIEPRAPNLPRIASQPVAQLLVDLGLPQDDLGPHGGLGPICMGPCAPWAPLRWATWAPCAALRSCASQGCAKRSLRLSRWPSSFFNSTAASIGALGSCNTHIILRFAWSCSVRRTHLTPPPLSLSAPPITLLRAGSDIGVVPLSAAAATRASASHTPEQTPNQQQVPVGSVRRAKPPPLRRTASTQPRARPRARRVPRLIRLIFDA